MAAPDRSAEVMAIVSTLPQAVETEADEARRALLYTIVRRLNQIDGGQWGVLRKDDQGGKIPADILVWAPTREHVDVLSGGVATATWQPKGIITNSAWAWQAVPPDAPPVVDPPVEPEPPPGDTLPAALARIEARLTAIETRLGAGGPAPTYDLALAVPWIGTARGTATPRQP